MDPEVYWELFCATGDPMAYMLYRTAAGEGKTSPPA